MAINTIFFYILSAICLVSGLFCMLQKNTMHTLISALVGFFAISGIYFTQQAYYAGSLLLLLCLLGVVLLKKTDVKKITEQSGFWLNIKAISVPFVCCVFVVLILPLILQETDYPLNYPISALIIFLTGVLIVILSGNIIKSLAGFGFMLNASCINFNLSVPGGEFTTVVITLFYVVLLLSGAALARLLNYKFKKLDTQDLNSIKSMDCEDNSDTVREGEI